MAADDSYRRDRKSCWVDPSHSCGPALTNEERVNAAGDDLATSITLNQRCSCRIPQNNPALSPDAGGFTPLIGTVRRSLS